MPFLVSGILLRALSSKTVAMRTPLSKSYNHPREHKTHPFTLRPHSHTRRLCCTRDARTRCTSFSAARFSTRSVRRARLHAHSGRGQFNKQGCIRSLEELSSTSKVACTLVEAPYLSRPNGLAMYGVTFRLQDPQTCLSQTQHCPLGHGLCSGAAQQSTHPLL